MTNGNQNTIANLNPPTQLFADPLGAQQPGTASRKIRVLIADNHLVVREGLAAILNRQEDMVVVGEAGNGSEALEQWRRYRPDITLMICACLRCRV